MYTFIVSNIVYIGSNITEPTFRSVPEVENMACWPATICDHTVHYA